MQMDEKYMQRCIDLARLGEGNVAPNPMVGAVIVLNDCIIGEGYHQKYGEAHAEVNAVNSVIDKSVLKDATIYVSLEPCAHFGKTPPCSDLLVHHQFNRVVIGCQDTFSEVSGKGIQKLKNTGIEVEVGILEKKCRELNKRFFTFHEKKRPFIILKWAQTQDGFIDVKRDGKSFGINWISSPETKVLVHKWRSEEHSILVGKNTVLNDNPTLTVREVTGNNPIRIVLDSHLEINNEANVYNDEASTIVFNELKDEVIGSVRYYKLPNLEAKTIINALYDLSIQSVFIEGGARTLQSFIDSNVWDEARVILGTNSFKEGVKAPFISKLPTISFDFSTDKVFIYNNL